jgi:hypothetical protein
MGVVLDPGYIVWQNGLADYKKDTLAWLASIKALKDALLAMVNMKGGAGEKMLFCTYAIFPDIESEKGSNIKILSATDNIDTGLREMMNHAQTIFTQSSTWSNPPTAKQIAETEKLYRAVQFLQYAIQNSGSVTIDGKTYTVVGTAELSQLSQSADDIQTQFGSDWGDYKQMAIDMQKWWASGQAVPPNIAQFNQYIAALLLENENNWGDPNLAILLPAVQKDPSAANLAELAKYLSKAYPNDPNVIGLKAMFGADWGKGTAMETDLVGWQQAGNGKMPQNVAAFDTYLQNLLKDDPGIWGLILAFGMAPSGPKQAAVLQAICEYLAQHDPNDPNTLGLEKLFGADWGNGTNMEADYNLWVNGNGNTPPPPPGPPVTAPQIKALQTDFQTIAQMVSTLDTAMSAKTSYCINDIDQFYGMNKTWNKGLWTVEETIQRNTVVK